MLRVLMVLEDYGELMFLQTVLKKMGFDVDGIQNPRAFSESVLRMNPDILVMTAAGKRVKGLELLRGVRRVRGLPRIILIQSPGAVPPQDTPVDTWLESPVGAVDLLNKIADLNGLDKQVLQEKFHKLKLKEIEEKSRVLNVSDGNEATLEKSTGLNTDGLAPSTLGQDERRQRYEKFLAEKLPTTEGFSIKDVQSKIRELRRMERPEDLEDLERERRAFVEHLFRKKA